MNNKSKPRWKQRLGQKLREFKSAGNKNRSPIRINKKYSVTDVINKFGETPKCYLTGRKINLVRMDLYSLDHIVPQSRGGTNDLSNLGITLLEANQAKSNMLLPEFLDLCEEILRNHRPYVLNKEK